MIAIIIHLSLCWYLVIHENLGVKGAALSTSLAYAVMLLLVLLISSRDPMLSRGQVRLEWGKLCFKKVIGLGFYNMLMASLKWWSF